ncbi:MAG: bifunctional metallophosphatase/5'-nucleotidase [Prevotella sp.]|nr:bifunctional metallophosphatase/5'-nucleotidase [Prevotella sp.]
MRKTLASALGAMALTIATTSVMAQENKTVSLRVVETSDVHGHFFPYDFVEGQPLKGTLARVNTYVNRLRRQYGDRLLLIDNGDILQGQPTCYWSNYVVGNADENIAAQVVNYMNYDAETFGNHDVETGHAVYDKWIREVRCPMLGANIVDKETGQPYVRPYQIFVRDGVKIAVLGMLTPTIPCWLNESLWQGLEFREMVATARQWVKHIREVEHADLIFGLFHSGLSGGITMPGGIEEDASERVAREVPGFDIIFFGHDHMQHNQWVTNTEGRKVLILDPSCWALNVVDAQIELTYTNGKLTRKDIKGDVVSVRDEAIDEAMVKHFQPQIDRIKDYVSRRIGRFENTTRTRDSYFGNSAFTDFVHNLQLQISKADISFNAPLSFDSEIKAGDVTVADMFKLYRFENQLYILKLTGREIRGHLEESYDRWVNTMRSADDHLLLLNDESRGDQQRMGFRNYTFNFDSAAGIDYEVDVTKPDGQKVRILRMSNGEPFDEQKTYRVVMNSYRGNGGGELLTKGAGIPKEKIDERIIYQSPLDLRHYLMEEIERMGSVSPAPNHNWRFVPEQWTKPAAERDRKLVFGETAL